MHVSCDTVSEFREDMKAFIQGFLDGKPGQRTWKTYELLLLAFMRDKVAPACDHEVSENLDVWHEKCEDEEEDIVSSFHLLMESLQKLDSKPAFFADIGYTDTQASKSDGISIFAINWMALHLLPVGKRSEWDDKVAKQWFQHGDTEPAKEFLLRAEAFLGKQVRSTTWGAKILFKVIETNSFVVVFRVEALAAVLLREHCRLLRDRNAPRHHASDCTTPPLLITSVVSSAS